MKKLLCTAVLMAGMSNVATAQELDEAQMLALTQIVLSGITAEADASASPAATEDLASLINQAMEQGQSDAYLEALIGEAVDNGTMEVSDGMMSTDGDVDTKALLAMIVQQSLQDSGSEPVLVAAAKGTSATDAVIREHTVSSGESLAAIALRYYGDASEYPVIFEANRDTISRPNLIRVGQIILIP